MEIIFYWSDDESPHVYTAWTDTQTVLSVLEIAFGAMLASGNDAQDEVCIFLPTKDIHIGLSAFRVSREGIVKFSEHPAGTIRPTYSDCKKRIGKTCHKVYAMVGLMGGMVWKNFFQSVFL